MSKNQYTAIMEEKNTEELILLYKKGVKGKNFLAPESFEAVKVELSKRELTEEQKQNMGLNVTENETSNISQPEKSTATIFPNNNDNEFGRYTALKTIIDLITALGYIVIIIGIIAFIYLGSSNNLGIGFIGFVISIVIALPLLAFSNLIYVFIDIEKNTRITSEAIKALKK